MGISDWSSDVCSSDLRYTVDTLKKLIRLHPNRRFIWIMGADNLVQLPQWRDWREIARLMPIAVIARPGYNDRAHARRAMGWLRRSEERRVGKECVSTCRSWGSP